MTTPKTPAKKVVNVEILHLDKTGYGYDGTYTREKWQAECLENFEAGAVAFLAWQESWQHLAEQNKLKANFRVLCTFDDGSTEEMGLYAQQQSHCLDFAGHIFKFDVRCQNCIFLNDVSFSKATFKGYVDFSEAIFDGNVDFSGANFIGGSFASIYILGFAYFDGATFEEYMDFCEAQFSSKAYFRITIFTGYADFSATAFADFALFSGAIFSCGANFGRATLGAAEFIGTTFAVEACFRCVTLVGNAYFSETKFSGNAEFEEANFRISVCFLKAEFLHKIDFRNSKFNGKTDFESAMLVNVGHFEGAKFTGENAEIPSFRGVDIGSTRLEFSDDTHFTKNDFSEEAIKNIAFLKHLSEQHGQIDQALSFNAMELRAKRLQVIEQLNVKDLNWLESSFKCANSGKWWVNCPTTWLYDKVSDFGRSFMRPLVGFVAIYGIAFSS
ncbi:MAG: pentapeptide repeat-containing protein [Gallionella sp.]